MSFSPLFLVTRQGTRGFFDSPLDFIDCPRNVISAPTTAQSARHFLCLVLSQGACGLKRRSPRVPRPATALQLRDIPLRTVECYLGEPGALDHVLHLL